MYRFEVLGFKSDLIKKILAIKSIIVLHFYIEQLRIFHIFCTKFLKLEGRHILTSILNQLKSPMIVK